MRPLRTRHRSAAIVVAACDVREHRLFGRRLRRLVTMMGALAQTASMLRRSFRLHRHRNNSADERDQQQKSGGNPLHAVWWAKPQFGLRIKQNLPAGKCRAQRDTGFAKITKFALDLPVRASWSPELPGVTTNLDEYLRSLPPGEEIAKWRYRVVIKV